MNPPNKLVTYTVKFDEEQKVFTLWDDNGNKIGEDSNGRELGREAWTFVRVEAVKYDYDLTKDEGIPLRVISRNAPY